MKLTPLENWVMRKSGMAQRSRELLEQYQLRRLQETIRYAQKNSRFYRESLKSIRADSIRSFEDFQGLPFTFPRQLSGNAPQFLCVPQSEIRRIVTLKSSGTSGAEKRVFFTKEDLDLTVDFFIHGMNCLTDQSDRVLVLLPGNSFGSIGDLLNKALAASGVACFVHGVIVDAEETARSIVQNNITCIVGIPAQVLYLSRTKSEAFQKIKKVLLSTDYVPRVLTDELTRRFGCRVFTHYGMTEMGYGGGVECEALQGYHMREADLYFEIVDPESGKPVKDGQSGEVVFTTLTRKAMNLIRYRTGDLASFSTVSCTCGTFLKTMNRVQGRLNNQISIGENRVFTLTELDEIVFAFRDVLDYQAFLKQDGCLCIEAAVESDEAYERVKDSIAHRIHEFLDNKFGEAFRTQIEIRRKNGPDKIINSMVKRKLCDYRQTGI